MYRRPIDRKLVMKMSREQKFSQFILAMSTGVFDDEMEDYGCLQRLVARHLPTSFVLFLSNAFWEPAMGLEPAYQWYVVFELNRIYISLCFTLSRECHCDHSFITQVNHWNGNNWMYTRILRKLNFNHISILLSVLRCDFNHISILLSVLRYHENVIATTHL